MRHALACGLLSFALPWPALAGDPPAPADQAAYQAAREDAGRDPDAHVRLALWCEQHGMTSRRLQHLALAVLYDPSHAAARGLMGMVRDRDGRWVKPEQVVEDLRKDAELAAALAEYNGRRARMDPDAGADEHWRLALWCEQNGLEAEARAHFIAVVRLDPGRDAAWKRLGYKKVNGRWRTDEQIADAKAERQAQKEANERWGKLLNQYRDQLRDPSTRAEAEQSLAAVTDPRAVSAVWSLFIKTRRPDPLRAVQLLGQIDAIASSRALAMLAVFAQADPVRQAASETLRHRDPREFADFLISLLRDELKYEVRPVGGPGSPGVLFVEGQRFNVQRLYSPPPMPFIPLYPGEPLYRDADGLLVVSRYLGETSYTSTPRLQPLARYSFEEAKTAHPGDPEEARALNRFRSSFDWSMHDFLAIRPETTWVYKTNRARFNEITGVRVQRTTTEHSVFDNYLAVPVGRIALEHLRAAKTAERQLEADIAAIDGYNARIRQRNARVVQILGDTTGAHLGEDRQRWSAWWTDQLGYSYVPEPERPRPTLVEQVPLAYRPAPVGPIYGRTMTFHETRSKVEVVAYSQISCFAAGTQIHTRDGLRPIETLQIGDLVLTQDTTTGALSYQPVMVTHHNPPSKTLAIKLGHETVVASTFHRFWKAGQGWVMARDLETGDTLRTLDGLRSVESIEPGSVQPVFNLDIAVGRSFFVGDQGALVHDNSVPDLRAEPFDRPVVLAQADAEMP